MCVCLQRRGVMSNKQCSHNVYIYVYKVCKKGIRQEIFELTLLNKKSNSKATYYIVFFFRWPTPLKWQTKTLLFRFVTKVLTDATVCAILILERFFYFSCIG